MTLAEKALLVASKAHDGSGATKAPARRQKGRNGLLPQPDSDFDGVAVMLVPQDEDAHSFSRMGALKQEHVHCTLMYYGDAADLLKRGYQKSSFIDALRLTAARMQVVQAKVNGITRFLHQGDLDPVVALISGDDVMHAHMRVKMALEAIGLHSASEHKFLPHVTLGYIKQNKPFMTHHMPPQEVFFDRLRIGFADDYYDFDLTGESKALDIKVRHVRDVAYWGLPYGTPIVAGMRPSPTPELDLGIVDPFNNAAPADRNRVATGVPGREHAARLRAAKEAFEALAELSQDDDDWRKAEDAKEKFNNTFDLSVENEWKTLAENVAGEGPWQNWNECRQIRVAAWNLLGYDSTSKVDTRPDPALGHYTHGGFDRRVNPTLEAMILLDGIMRAEPMDRTFYRGVTHVDPDEFVKDLKEGRTFDLPLASFADDRSQTARFGTDVTFVLQRGSKGVKGGTMGPPPGISEEDEGYWDYYDDEDNQFEYVTGGRFIVTGVRKNSKGYTIIIRQQAVFDPTTGLLQTKDVGADVPDFDWAFDFPLAPEQTDKEEKAVPLKCKDCGKTYFTDDMDNITHEGCEKKGVYGGMSGIGVSPAGLNGVSRKHPGLKRKKTRHDVLPRKKRRTIRERALGIGFKDYRDEAPRDPEGAWVDTTLSLSAVREVRMKTNLSNDDPKVQKFVKIIKKTKKFPGYIKIEKTTAGDLMTDGHHRLLAAELVGFITEVPVRIFADTPEGRAAAHAESKWGLFDRAKQIEQKAGLPRDGDGDGFIFDGKPGMRPAPLGTPVVGDLVTAKPTINFGKDYHGVADKHGQVYIVGPDPEDPGFIVISDPPSAEEAWDDIVVEQAKTQVEALELLDARTRQKRKRGDKSVHGSLSKNPTKINMPKRSSSEREDDAAKTRAAQAAAKKAAHKTAAKKDRTDTPKKTTGKPLSQPRKAGVAKKAKAVARKASYKKTLTTSGGDRPVSDKKGVEMVAPLETQARTGKRPAIPKRPGKESRIDPKDYKFKGSKPDQSPAARKAAALGAGVTDKQVQKKIDQDGKYTFNIAHENEHLWFPSDPKSPVAYSYVPILPFIDKNGKRHYTVPPAKFKTKADGSLHRMVAYKKSYLDENKELKRARILSIAQNIDKLDMGLHKDAKKDPSAGSVMLMRMLGIRVNSESEEAQARKKGDRSETRAQSLAARGVDTSKEHIYGASSLRKRHVKFNSDGTAEIEFYGKEHVLNTHYIEDAELVATLKHWAGKAKDPDSPLFPGVTDKTTNDYIQKFMGPNVSNKDLRDLVATSLAATLIKRAKPPASMEEYLQMQADIALRVSMTLNNKAQQALDTYINPGVWKKWEDGLE